MVDQSPLIEALPPYHREESQCTYLDHHYHSHYSGGVAPKVPPLKDIRGFQVQFAYPHVGYDCQRDKVARYGLQQGTYYTVEDFTPGQSSNTITLCEFPGVSFNGSHFCFCSLERQRKPLETP